MKKGMSPNLKFSDSDVTKGAINGPRPPPLRIGKDSRVIHKPAAAKRQPVIIYTHSPKVIRAAPNDFMKLVQRLTGLSNDDDDSDAAEKAVKEEDVFTDEKRASSSSGGGGTNNGGGGGFYEENCETVSSILADDRRFVAEVKQDPAAAAAVSPMYKMSNAYLVEAAPLFTATGSNDFFCSPRTSSVFQSAMAASAISPSFMDYMKALPDYTDRWFVVDED